jgi:hypothetical protein
MPARCANPVIRFPRSDQARRDRDLPTEIQGGAGAKTTKIVNIHKSPKTLEWDNGCPYHLMAKAALGLAVDGLVP